MDRALGKERRKDFPEEEIDMELQYKTSDGESRKEGTCFLFF